MTRLDSVERAVADIAAGKAVVVIDDEDRENEGDLIFAAEKATPEIVAFMVRYTSGYLCVPLDGAICDRLGLLPMYASTRTSTAPPTPSPSTRGTGVGTGISASDRATTMRMLADPTCRRRFHPARPRVPLRAKEGGVLRRPGHTEAAVDLARLAGLQPAGVICEIVSQKDDGAMARPTNCGASPTSTASADLHRRPDRVAAQAREAHPARRRGAHPDPARRVPRVRLHQHLRRCRTRRAGPRRHRRPARRRARRAGAGALGMPDRRRVRIPPL